MFNAIPSPYLNIIENCTFTNILPNENQGKQQQIGLLQVLSYISSLSNAATSFSSYINKILANKLDIFMIVYQDNIFIYMKDFK